MVKEGSNIRIDISERGIVCDGREFKFGLSFIEEKLTSGGGMIPLFKRLGNAVFDELQGKTAVPKPIGTGSCGADVMEW